MKSLPLFLIIIGILLPFFSYLITFWNIRLARFFGIVDVPNQRSSHTEPTPSGGGLAIVFTVVLYLFIARSHLGTTSAQFWGLIVNAILIAGLGFFDDLYTLRRLPRIIGWVVIAISSLVFGIELTSISLPLIGLVNFGFLSPLITFVWLIGVTNFFNFMDGINGLAGGEALLVSGFLGGIALLSGNGFVFAVSLIIFGTVLGFLPHNFPRAKLFLGDVGSNFLGYVFASVAVIASQQDAGYIPFLIPVILLNMFLLDAGTTLIKRIPKGKDWLEPHRDHVYQRLIKLGYSHVQVTILYSILNLILGFLALLAYLSQEWVAFVLTAASFIPFIVLISLTYRIEQKRFGYNDPRE